MKYSRNLSFKIDDIENYDEMVLVFQALSSKVRLEILHLLCQTTKSMSELAKIFDVRESTIRFHINILERAKLVLVAYSPHKKGHIKICTRYVREIGLIIRTKSTKTLEKQVIYSLPVSHYTDAITDHEFGMVNQEESLLLDKHQLFDASRFQMTSLWTLGGMVIYHFPTIDQTQNQIGALTFSLEICSETPGYNNNWKSDITFSVNDIELLTWTSMGDYGDRPGKLNPEWWVKENTTQYGQLKSITIDEQGVRLDGVLINHDVTLKDIDLNQNKIAFKIETKKNAKHYGGFNILGKGLGDYNQDIELQITYIEQ